MSANRANALSSLSNTNLEVIFIDHSNLSKWIKDDSPLHPSFKYLSSVHKADYLRCYFMHHYGGAYSDIKIIEDSWLSAFRELEESTNFINGYREINFIETARGRGLLKDLWLSLNFYRVVGLGAFICKPNTIFTSDWLNAIHRVLDKKIDLLQTNPSKDPRDFYHKKLDKDNLSEYPLRWTEICGEIFHPLCLKHSKKLLKSLPTPDFTKPYL